MMERVRLHFKKRKLRGQLQNVFRLGDICKKVKTQKNTYTRYPAIHDVTIDEDRGAVRFTFTLPEGTDPNLVLKQDWLFKQVFGNNIEIKGKIKRFTLWVYKEDMTKGFMFNYEELAEKAKNMHLPVIAGKNSHGNIQLFDMVDNSHMLIMGETGSGKSVYLRSIITFLTLHMGTKIKFYLADMKRTEFFLFRNLKSVESVVFDKAALDSELAQIKAELEMRGKLFNQHEVAHIDEYNALRSTEKKLPYLLVCIDEVAILKREKRIMSIIEEISCIGRALGCFLILSLQRGDSKVLEGQLKNNLTVRCVFRTADKINSDIGLGRGSEENAADISRKDKGKFYFKLEDTQLIQAPLLKLNEAKRLLEPYKEQKQEREKQEEEKVNEFSFDGVISDE